jgi:hypothetical protein
MDRARPTNGSDRGKHDLTLVVVAAEVHWYEAHGIGKVKFKVKEWL